MVVSVAYFSHQNGPLLAEHFALTPATSVPMWVAFLGVFLVGFLPAVSALVVHSVKRDLAQRRERRLEREAQSLQGSFRRGIDYQADGQWGRAAAELEAVQGDRPEDFDALLRYGQVLRRQERVEEALDVHRRASVLYPQSVAVLYELAADYAAHGEPAVAEQIEERILRDFPGHGLAALEARRRDAVETEAWTTALHLQERVEPLRTEGGVPLDEAEAATRRGLAYQQGVALLEGGRPGEARRVFQGLLAATPGFLPAALALGETALVEGDDREALSQWRSGYQETGRPVFLQRIEDHFIEHEDPLSAIETLHQISAEAPRAVLPRFFLGRLYHRLEMQEEALAVLRELSEPLASSASYHLLMARLHQRRGEPGRAVEAAMAALALVGVSASEYVCDTCETRYSTWRDRCSLCGCWGTVDLEVGVEEPSQEALPARPEAWETEGELL
ncbi:MAG: tetratricopeptide repeat protein [Thermoanaerobaculia bacterium]